MATPSPSTPDRAASFGLVAEEYGRLRPAPQDEAIDWMLPQQASVVLDLAAGAGTLTALLPPRVRQVHAVEPDGRMRAVLAERLPDADVRAGTAEAIPLPDASVDAVIVASAWHWFDTDRAVPEIARVLRPGGRLGVVWNSIDRRVDWVDRWSGSLGGHGGQPAPRAASPAAASCCAPRWRHPTRPSARWSTPTSPPPAAPPRPRRRRCSAPTAASSCCPNSSAESCWPEPWTRSARSSASARTTPSTSPSTPPPGGRHAASALPAP